MASINKVAQDEVIAMTHQALRVGSSIDQQVLRNLRQLENNIVKQLRTVDPTGPVRTRYREQRLTQLLESTRADIKEVYSGVNKYTQKQYADLLLLQTDEFVAVLNESLGVSMLGAVDPVRLKLIAKQGVIEGARSAEWWAGQSRSLQQTFERNMRQGMLLNEDIPTLTRRIKGSRGFMQKTYRDAQMLVRTSVINLNNQARSEMMKQNSDVIGAIKWLSTLDTRTTVICMSLDGKKWTVDDNKPIGHTQPYPGPTAHYGCRSTQVPVIKPFTQIKGKKKLQLDEGARQSLDGAVPSGTTFDGFLKKQPASVQIDMLGKERRELWRKGKVSLSQMLDTSGRPLTVQELRTKYVSKRKLK